MGEDKIPSPDDYLDATFSEGGYLARAFDGYRPRAGQVALAHAVDAAITGKKHLLADAPCGCHAAGQGILKSDGRTVVVENIVVGDVLLGPGGSRRTVSSVVSGEQEMVWIRPTKGKPWRVNLDHVLTLQRTGNVKDLSRSGRKKRADKTGEIIDVSVRNWLAWARSLKALYKLVRSNVNSFDSETSEFVIPPYYLGIILGDGSMSSGTGSVSICKRDPEIKVAAQELAELLGLRIRTCLRTQNDREPVPAYFIVGDQFGGRTPNPLIRALKDLGLYPAGSGDKFVPHRYKTASVKHRLQMLAGLIDTDGSYSRGCYDFISKSERLSSDLVFLARSVGLAGYVKPEIKKWQNGEDVYFRVVLSGDINRIPCRIPRKQASAREQIKSVLRTGFTVERTGIVDRYYGFSLDGDGRYLLDDFTVTHNTGKSIGYAVPVTYHAWRSEKTAILVTQNNALAEQLINKDLPLLQRIVPWPFTFGMLKGRANYLCRDQHEKYLQQTFAQKDFGFPNQEKTYLPLVEQWAKDCVATGPYRWDDRAHDYVGELGDKSDLPIDVPSIWHRFSVDSEGCKKSRCKFNESCFSNVAHRRAREARIIVTNYHMLMAHLRVVMDTGGEAYVLPPFNVCVLDEAHAAPDIAREFFGFRISELSIRRLVRLVEEANPTLAAQTERASSWFFAEMASLKRDERRYKSHLTGDYTGTELKAWEALLGAVTDVSAHLTRQLTSLTDDLANGDESAEGKIGDVELAANRAADMVNHLRSVANPELDDRNVYYLDEDSRARVAVASKLVYPGDALRPTLFLGQADPLGIEDERITVIATSATLATGTGSFSFIAHELGVPDDHTTLVAESPFDWANQCLFVCPASMPEPSSGNFREAVAMTMETIIRAAGGRTLGLFTSRKVLELTHDQLVAPCRLLGYRLLKQGDAPRSKLIEQFKNDTTSVLLATRSFWAGVDIPGESLSVVVMDRLPFPSPDDPIAAALNLKDDKSFWKYNVPLAIIEFRQGAGRLIRSAECRGVIVCLDSRLLTKKYAKDFLRALPAEIPKSRSLDAIGPWLNRPRGVFE